jgi:hypothetical protein
MIKSVTIVLLFTVFLMACKPSEQGGNSPLLPFFGLNPKDSSTLIGPDFISTNLQEYNGTFSPQGTEFYYTIQFPKTAAIAFVKLGVDGKWSDPTIASFSGKHSDVDPLFSPDGTRLYFTSFRPVENSPTERRANIWYVERMGREWSDPVFVPLTQDGDFYSSLTRNGTLYFNVGKTGDLYKGNVTPDGYSVERLPEPLNSTESESDPFISPDEDYIIFRAYNREGGLGGADLYISFNFNNVWTNPENLGNKINSSADEMCPSVTHDGKLLIFSSNRLVEDIKIDSSVRVELFVQKFKSHDNGFFNIYTTSTEFIEELRNKHQ